MSCIEYDHLISQGRDSTGDPPILSSQSLLLMEEIIDSACTDYIRYPDGHELFILARGWLFEEDGDSGSVTSFDYICEVIGYNKDKVRFCVNWEKDKNKGRVKKGKGGTFCNFLTRCRTRV